MQKLYMKEKLISVHDVYRIYDENDAEKYEIRSKYLSMHNKTYLYDMQNNQLAESESKLISLHETHYITLTTGETTEMHTELMHVVNQVIDLKDWGWVFKGNILDHDFTIYDGNEQPVAEVHRKWVALSEAFEITIYNDSDEIKVLAALMAFECVLRTRKELAVDSAEDAANRTRLNNN